MTQIQFDSYYHLAEFIARILGPSFGVSLFDFNATDKNKALLFSNNDADGSSNASMVDYLQKLYANLHSDQVPYLYDVIFPESADVRTNIFFLSDDNASTLGALTVSCNIGERNHLMANLQKMLNLVPSAPSMNRPYECENDESSAIPKNLSSEMLPMLVASILREHSIEPGQAQLSPDEKIEIINILNERGVFILKNAVIEVAAQLNSSECTIYRYLSKLNRKNTNNVWEPVSLV